MNTKDFKELLEGVREGGQALKILEVKQENMQF